MCVTLFSLLVSSVPLLNSIICRPTTSKEFSPLILSKKPAEGGTRCQCPLCFKLRGGAFGPVFSSFLFVLFFVGFLGRVSLSCNLAKEKL